MFDLATARIGLVRSGRKRRGLRIYLPYVSQEEIKERFDLDYPKFQPYHQQTPENAAEWKTYLRRERQLLRERLAEWLGSEDAKALGLSPEVKAQWRRKAGCSCGCSPAFVVRDVEATYENQQVAEVYVMCDA